MPPVQPAGYLATPPGATGRAVLVLHAWWGLNATIRAFCDRLAQAGFIAFAPDLYHGKVTDTIAEAESLSAAVFADVDAARADVTRAAAYVMEHAGETADGLAVIGFSLGAFFALDLSVSDPEHVRSVVLYYGTRPGDYGDARAAYLGHFAERDAFEPRAEVDGLEAALKQAGRPVTFHHYRDTGHWFAEPDRLKAYDTVAASLAWERTLAFLKRDTHG